MSHHIVDESLDIAPSSLGKVLVLEVRFTLPGINGEVTLDIQHASGNFHCGTVTDELVHGTTLADDFK